MVYLTSVWLHILAATAWIGGMFFLVLVVVPWLRKGSSASPGAFLRETGERFRTVGWVSFGLLLLTGTVSLWFRGVRPGDLIDPVWLATPFGKALSLKLGAFALVLGLSAVHDFVVGPRAALAIERDPGSPRAGALRRQASLLGRLNALLALVLVAAGVMLVRGWPW